MCTCTCDLTLEVIRSSAEERHGLSVLEGEEPVRSKPVVVAVRIRMIAGWVGATWNLTRESLLKPIKVPSKSERHGLYQLGVNVADNNWSVRPQRSHSRDPSSAGRVPDHSTGFDETSQDFEEFHQTVLLCPPWLVPFLAGLFVLAVQPLEFVDVNRSRHVVNVATGGGVIRQCFVYTPRHNISN